MNYMYRQRPLSSSTSSKQSIPLTPKVSKTSSSCKRMNTPNRLDSKHQATVYKIEKMRNEQQNKIMNEMRRTPEINSNSRKIIERLSLNTQENNSRESNRNKNTNNYLNRSNHTVASTAQTNMSDYIAMIEKRKKIMRDIEKKKNMQHNDITIKRSSSKVKNKSQVKKDYKPVIINDGEYRRYNAKEVFNVRNKFHNYYNNYMYGNKKIDTQSYRTNVTNDNVQNKLEICTNEEIKAIQNEQPKIENKKNYNNFNKKVSIAQSKENISKRENDLKKFMMFTNEIAKSNNPPKKKEEPAIGRMKVIEYNDEDDYNQDMGRGYEIEDNEMKLNEVSKAFVEERMRRLKENIYNNH